MRYVLAFVTLLCTFGLVPTPSHAQATGDAVKDAQIQKLWTSCKTAPQTDFVHICLRDMTNAAHLWTQAEAAKAAKAKAVKK